MFAPAGPAGQPDSGARRGSAHQCIRRPAAGVDNVASVPVLGTALARLARAQRSLGGTPMDGFKKFLLRGNLVELAVAVVIGLAFAAIITALVADLITPLIAAIGGEPRFSAT